MSVTAPAAFEYESAVANHLRTAAIPGLDVLVTADVSEAKFKTLHRPTAIVALGDETAGNGNYRAVVSECTVLVYLVLRGALPERTGADQFFREELFQALHGEQLPGLNGELSWKSTVPDYEGNARTYLLTFAAPLTKRKR